MSETLDPKSGFGMLVAIVKSHTERIDRLEEYVTKQNNAIKQLQMSALDLQQRITKLEDIIQKTLGDGR